VFPITFALIDCVPPLLPLGDVTHPEFLKPVKYWLLIVCVAPVDGLYTFVVAVGVDVDVVVFVGVVDIPADFKADILDTPILGVDVVAI